MAKKRTYKAVRVQQVDVEALLPLLLAGCIIAIDVAKQKFVVALATAMGEVVKFFRFDHPTETPDFLRLVEALRRGVGEDKVAAAMEPTGTYGDAIRHQMVRARVPVHMVSSKRTHDTRELLDGVPSMHDAKSAMIIAHLHGAMKLSTEWKEPPETQRRLRALVDLRMHEQRREELCYGQMEAMLSRHWPELGQWLDVRRQKSALKLLEEYPNPARVSEHAADARELLHRESRKGLSAEALSGVIAGAAATLGVPMVVEEEATLRALARHALDARAHTNELESSMQALAMHDEVFARLATFCGVYTAAVLVTMCDPRQYRTACQMEKACGLNLREKSSGEHEGRLSITKRGPGLVRQVLYMLALRKIQEQPAVAAWYKRRRGYSEGSRQRAVVAVMRKLVRALFHVAKGAEFDASKLFDLRRLDLGTDAPTDAATEQAPSKKRPIPRTTPQPIARSSKRGRRREEVAASSAA